MSRDVVAYLAKRYASKVPGTILRSDDLCIGWWLRDVGIVPTNLIHRVCHRECAENFLSLHPVRTTKKFQTIYKRVVNKDWPFCNKDVTPDYEEEKW